VSERPVDLLLTLKRDGDTGEGLTRQIYGQLRAAILAGRLRAGERLPPTRELARRLGTARLTVATAYEWLRAEGYVYGRVGAGTFVAPALSEMRGIESDPRGNTLPSPRPSDSHVSARPEPAGMTRAPLTAWAQRIASIPLTGAGGADGAEFDFRPGVGDADAFPWVRWRRVVGWQDPADRQAERRAAANVRAASRGHWDALLGPIETRDAIAAWLRRSRAVRCEPEQVLVAGSVQQVLALLARLLVEPGQSLIVEDPSYVGFHAAFLAEGARLTGVPVDAAGLKVVDLPDPAAASAATAAHLAVVTPSHQYPTGVTLTLERRLALLDWARRAHVVVVEDDYDGDLRLEGQPLEALRGLDDRDEVIYLGTFAKALYPAMRMGYAVLPRWLVEPVARARAASDRHPTWRDALAVARFIEAGELERHLVRVRRLYRARRDALEEALRAELGELVAIGPAEAGVHLLVELPAGTDDVSLARTAQSRGIAVTALSPHYNADPRPGLLLGFGAMSEARLAEGVRQLAPLVRDACASAPHQSGIIARPR
jgi:GntR family transcriptional regulator/MocR family aminotransferase